jgi:hypothetical protein
VGAATLGIMKRDMPHALVRLQEGVFSREQALENGLTTKMIDARLRTGAWRAILRGVYTNRAADIDRPGMRWAAVLWAGRYAMLSHQTAAEMLKLGGRPDDDIHVTVPAARRVDAVPGIRVHRTRRAFQLVLAEYAVPCTSVEETALDMVDLSDSFDEMCGWVTRALSRDKNRGVKLRDAMAKRGRLRWRSILGPMIDATISGDNSVLEHRYDRDVERAHGLPEPDRQVPFTKPDGKQGFRDRAYPGYHVVVELDGVLYHSREKVWEDKERDNAAIESGYEPLRYGWRHVTQLACMTAVQVARVLTANGWTGLAQPCSVRCPIRQARER